MHGSVPRSAGVSRREFARRAALITIAAGASGVTLVGSSARSIAPIVTGSVSGPGAIAGLARAGGALVAVGGGEASPSVWRRVGSGVWTTLADGDAFPPGTTLTDVDAVGERLVAVGSIQTPQGPTPAAFRSNDGETWASLAMPGAVPHLGGATSVAAYDARFLTVGAGVESPEVQEPAGAFGVEVRLDGTTRWAGRGLPAPRHGAITMAASLTGGFLVGATDVAGMRLATAPTAGGPWAPVPPPPIGAPAAPVAAATLDGFTVLAIVDGDARTSWWRREPRGWTEVPPVAGVDPSVTVRAVVGSARRAAVAGVAGHDHVFREVAA